jgi:O-antigen/teichoic acid export membrane protein
MSLRDKAANGTVWTSIGIIGGGVLYFILTMILARILTPADFGLVQLLSVFTIITESIIDSGFGQAVIKDKNATRIDLSSVFFFNVIIAIALYTILFFAAPLIASFYQEPKLVPLSRFVFLTIIFYSCSIIQDANFDRTLNFRPQAIATVLSIVISGGVALYLAFHGEGVWSLATYLVLYAFLRMLLLWLFSSWKPVFKISIDSIKRYFRFGINLLVQGLIDKIVSNLESLFIGKIYTKTDLGYVSQGQKADSYIAQKATGVIKKVSYPILAHLNSDSGDIKTGYRRVLKITMYFLMPLMFFTIASADNLLCSLFGSQWLPSTPYMRLASVSGLSVSFYSIFINVFYVKDKTRQFLYISIIRQVLRVAVLLLLVRKGIVVLLCGTTAVSLFSALMYSFFGGRLIKYSLKEIIIDLWKTFAPALFASICIYTLPFYVGISNRFLLCMIQLILMVVVYVPSTRFLKNPAFFEAVSIIKPFWNKIIRKRNA